MKKIIIVLFALFTLTSYSQDNDDIYWTVYDVDTVEEETNTYVTNNYYTDYTSRINRFHRHPYYTSYWSYHNPYWYSYYYPFYTSYYWWWGYNSWSYYGWYSPYRNWYSHYNYSHYYRPTYYYAHHSHNHNYYKKSNPNKKQVVHNPKYIKKPVYKTHSKPKNINKPTYQTYSKPKPTIKKYPTYSKPVKYTHVKPQPTRPVNIIKKPQYIKPKSIQRPVKVTPTSPKIRHTRPVGIRKPK